MKMPNVNTSRGAPMGRAVFHSADRQAAHKTRLYHVPLDSGGYDNGGAYWGHGLRLYCAESEPQWMESEQRDSEPFRLFLRAYSREAAKEQVREKYPNARFYR